MTDLKTVHFVSLGCPKNRVDTEVLAGFAKVQGLTIVADPSDADVIVVNTCAFIESAREESIDTLLEMHALRQTGRLKRLISAGCLSQRYGEALKREMPELDHVLGTEALGSIGQIIADTAPVVNVGLAAHFLQTPKTPRFIEPGAVSAYIKIGDGCTRTCAFCAIPAIRGPGRSRPLKEIVAEAEQLAASGIREINLVSQDTSAYGKDLSPGSDLLDLLDALCGVSGIAWIRLLYLYPDAIVDRLIDALPSLAKVVPYVDMPIQHASQEMLARMRRGYGQGRLKRLIAHAHQADNAIFLRTAVLVGHPGETDGDFADLIEFLEWARCHHLGAFRYSDEEGTPAFGTGPGVSKRASYNRWRKVMALGRRLSRAHNRKLVGTTLDILIEAPADDQGFVLRGRHPGQAPDIDGATYLVSSNAKPGDIVRAKVTKADDFDIVATPLMSSQTNSAG
ncbi:MAG: 30S ribosomal protein S12 methylthiotransferase RimO [Myxococcota bacterium]|nr:30S ribosomal protein S12 methylthiotransferase RimO [Myxococcota bacterium]